LIFLKNYLDDSEVLFKNTRAKLKKVLVVVLEDSQISRSLTPEFEAMANKSLREFSASTTANICTGPEVNVGDNGFEFKSALITMVQANQFHGRNHEDASAHLQHLLETSSTFTIKGVTRDAIILCLFLFSLLGKAKQWFYANKRKHTIWNNYSAAFVAKFFPTSKTNALSRKISSFQQQHDELGSVA
jgi:hypothetical protein